MQDYVSARAWRDGLGMYRDTLDLATRYLGPGATCYQYTAELRNPHPPAFILLFVPLSYLPYHAARLVWLFLSASILAATLAAIARRLGLSIFVSVAIGLGCLALPITQRSLSFGQSNELLLLLLGLCWLFLRRGRDGLAGFMLGLAAALRVFPAILLIPLLRERRLKASVWFLGTATGLSLASFLFVGGSNLKTFFSVAAPQNFHFWVSQPMNISLVGSAVRWLIPSIWFQDGINAPVFAYLIGAVLTIAGILAIARTPARATNDLFLAAIPWMILLSPLAWPHYAVATLLVLVAMAALGYRRAEFPSLLCVAGWCAIATGGLPWVSTEIGHISVVSQLFGYGVPLYGLLLLAYVEWRGAWRETPLIETPSDLAFSRSVAV